MPILTAGAVSIGVVLSLSKKAKYGWGCEHLPSTHWLYSNKQGKCEKSGRDDPLFFLSFFFLFFEGSFRCCFSVLFCFLFLCSFVCLFVLLLPSSFFSLLVLHYGNIIRFSFSERNNPKIRPCQLLPSQILVCIAGMNSVRIHTEQRLSGYPTPPSPAHDL